MKCTNAQLNILGKIRISGDSTIITNSTQIFDEYYQLFQSDINKQILDGNKFLYFDKEITEISNNQIIQTKYDGEGEIVLFDNPESNLQGFYLEVFRGNTNLPVYYKYWEECEDRKSSDEYLQEKWGVNFYYTTELYEGNDKQTLIIYKYINGEFARTGNSFIINNDDNLIPCIIVKYTGINYPDGAEEGDYFYNTTTQKLYVLQGLEWTEEEILNGYFYYFESDEDEESEGVPAIIVDNYLSLLSANPVENRVITAALNDKQDKLDIDTEVREGSNNVVTGDAVFQALKDYKPKKPCIIVKFVGTSYPQNAEEGDYFYNKNTEKLYQYLNSTWVETEILDGYFYHFEGNDNDDEEEQQTIIIDGFLSLSSRNPVENRVITQALEDICYSDCLNQRFEELSNMIEELTPSAGDEPAPVLFSPGQGITITTEYNEDNQPVIVISVTNDVMNNANYNVPALLERVRILEQKVTELIPVNPDDPDTPSVIVRFDPLIGNWGTIPLGRDMNPEDITVSDIMDPQYDIEPLNDYTTTTIWSTGDTAPEGEYFITAEKAGLRTWNEGANTVDQMYINRKILCELTSNEGTYANCVGLILGTDGEKTYYIDEIPGDGTQRTRTINNRNYTYQTVDEGLSTTHCQDYGIVIKKDFTIVGLTSENGKATSGFTHPISTSKGPFFFTRHSLNLIGVKFSQRYPGYGGIIIDSIDGIEQVQIKNCYFTHRADDLSAKTVAVAFIGRDELPINTTTEELREDNCIHDLLIYNNIFDGSDCIQNFFSGISTISNEQSARYLKSCRIVNNLFTSNEFYAINMCMNNSTTYDPITAFTQCPLYFAGNTISGVERVVDADGSGTQHSSIYLEMGRTYILHNTLKNVLIYQSSSTETSFAYTSCAALYFCNNICENIAKFSSNKNIAGLVLAKNPQSPSMYNSRYSSARYFHSNVFKQNLSLIKSLWDNFVDSKLNGTTSIDFDYSCIVPVIGYIEEPLDKLIIKNNTYSVRGIFGISGASCTRAKQVIIDNNTFNFGIQKFYSNNDTSSIFTLIDAESVTITNNKFKTGLSDIRLVTFMYDSSHPLLSDDNINISGNKVMSNLTTLTRINCSKSNWTPRSSILENPGGSVIPQADISVYERAIITGDTTPVT